MATVLLDYASCGAGLKPVRYQLPVSRWSLYSALGLFGSITMIGVGTLAPAFHWCRKDYIQGGPIRSTGSCDLFIAIEVGGLILFLLSAACLLVFFVLDVRRHVRQTNASLKPQR